MSTASEYPANPAPMTCRVVVATSGPSGTFTTHSESDDASCVDAAMAAALSQVSPMDFPYTVTVYATMLGEEQEVGSWRCLAVNSGDA